MYAQISDIRADFVRPALVSLEAYQWVASPQADPTLVMLNLHGLAGPRLWGLAKKIAVSVDALN
ncbi:MAG: hypothetical protein CMQ49_01130 [Gammaproteobacteria bacterium]|nr:hypothetical protein [Gammaproteobacteria bacterium]